MSDAIQQMLKLSFKLDAWIEAMAGIPGEKRKAKQGGGVNEATFTPLLNVRSAALALKLKNDIQLRVQFRCDREADSRLAEQAFKTLLAVINATLDKAQNAKRETSFAKALLKSLAQAKIKRTENTVHFGVALRVVSVEALIRYLNQSIMEDNKEPRKKKKAQPLKHNPF